MPDETKKVPKPIILVYKLTSKAISISEKNKQTKTNKTKQKTCGENHIMWGKTYKYAI